MATVPASSLGTGAEGPEASSEVPDTFANLGTADASRTDPLSVLQHTIAPRTQPGRPTPARIPVSDPSPAVRFAAAVRDRLQNEGIRLDAPGVRVLILGEANDAHGQSVRAAVDGATGLLRDADVQSVSEHYSSAPPEISNAADRLYMRLASLSLEMRTGKPSREQWKELLVKQYVFGLIAEQANMAAALAASSPDHLQIASMSVVSPSWHEVLGTATRELLESRDLNLGVYDYAFEKMVALRDEALTEPWATELIEATLARHSSLLDEGLQRNTLFIRSVSNGYEAATG
ncbi:MAG: hypothetical protein AAFY60_16180, partial [Myxococcota bacterium]